ncbi:MAG: Lpg1974 family pore-forming outer membrane protein, partial [Planctomycetia bacterium]
DVRLVFQKLDLLATQMVSFRKWDLMFLGGVTYAGNEVSTSQSTTILTSSQRNRFDGWGLTAGTLAYRDIGWFEGLQGYGGVQWSGVYGNSPGVFTNVNPGGTFTNTYAGESTMLSILELKVGTQYERRIGWGAIGFVSAGFESQYWTPLDSYLGNVGLVGFTVGTGIRR